MAFLYAYIQRLDGPVNWFSLTFCILIQVFLLLTVALRGVSNKHCLCLFFIDFVETDSDEGQNTHNLVSFLS